MGCIKSIDLEVRDVSKKFPEVSKEKVIEMIPFNCAGCNKLVRQSYTSVSTCQKCNMYCHTRCLMGVKVCPGCPKPIYL